MKYKLNWEGDCHVTTNKIKRELRIYIHQNDTNVVLIQEDTPLKILETCHLWNNVKWNEYLENNIFTWKEL